MSGDPLLSWAADFQARLVAMQDMAEAYAAATGQRLKTREGVAAVMLYHGTSDHAAATIFSTGKLLRGAFFYASIEDAVAHAKMRFGADGSTMRFQVDPRCVSFSSGTGEFYAEGALTRDNGVWSECRHG